MSQEKYIYLIYQQIQGVLTPSEEENLQKWLNESLENQKIQEEIVQSMALMEDYQPSFSIDEAGDYAKISKELGFSNSVPKEAKQVNIFNRRRFLGIAATLALLITAALFYINAPQATLEWTAFETNDQEVKKITLPDGTIVSLNKNSKIEFPKAFLGSNRPVQLQGEAFFQVKRDENKPFQISNRNSQVTVLGTEFNVRDYPNETSTTVSVLSGKVAFSSPNDAQKVILTANKAAVMDINTKKITPLASANQNTFSYQSGKLVFKNTPLTEVFKDLANHFNVVIECQNKALNTCNYSLTKQSVDLDKLLSTLKRLYQINIEKSSDQKYIVSGGGC